MDPQAPPAPTEPEQPTETPETTPAPEQQATPPAPTTTSGGKGYGKRPVWQWVVIYLIVAIVLYGLAYLIFFHKGSTAGGGLNY